MNAHQIAGKWIELRGRVRERWGLLMHSDQDVEAGRRNQLVGMVQQHYNTARDDAERRVDRFARRHQSAF